MRIPLLFLLPVFALVVSAEPLTQGERDRAMSHLHATRKLFVDATAQLTPAQWNFKPGPDRWSVAQCAEHLAETETFLRGILAAEVAKSAPDDAKREARRATRDRDDRAVLETTADRSKKAQAPEPLRPTGRLGSPSAAVDAFKQRRLDTIHYVETTTDDLRGRFFSVAPGSEMDLYELLLLISAHTERHVKQMREVMAAPGYPR